MRNCIRLLATLAIVLVGCSTTPKAPPQPYTRIANPDTNTVQLQIAVRKFVPARGRGPVIWLVGTAHVGDPSYYATLQTFLDAQTVVLFEGINADAHPRKVGTKTAVPINPHPAPRPAPDDTNAPFSMQSALAKSLGLVFQLDAIDYDRTNFFNSDLSVFEIQRLMTGDTNAVPAQPVEHVETGTSGQRGQSRGSRGESGGSGKGDESNDSNSFNTLLQIMDGSSFIGGIVKMAIGIIGSSPSLQATTRFVLIEAIGQLKGGDITGMQGVPPDLKKLLQVLIENRNQRVIDDLKTELKQVPPTESIAVFYGTGHMDDMERRVTGQLHYRPADDLWFTAFASDLRDTGMTPGGIRFLRNLIKSQMDQMQAPEQPGGDRK